MVTSPGQSKFNDFRKKFSFFTFEGYQIELQDQILNIQYEFNLSDIHQFRPSYQISLVHLPLKPGPAMIDKDPLLHQLVFHIGMIELISYWKATCAKKIIIEPQKLDNNQVKWWKKLYFHGLGEFFYLNKIETNAEDFVEIVVEGEKEIPVSDQKFSNEFIIPVGGGKDSAVSLELLRHAYKCRPFLLNPRGAMDQTIEVAGFQKSDAIVFRRTLDPLLLSLNSQGYLNGHTPFSALLAFVSLLASYLNQSANIALSNESSANEPTIPGTNINHQYSKSVEFEKDFREYVKQYIHTSFNYFSFLRPLSELQIAGIFSRLKPYHPVFKSCNAGSKTDSWCGQCSKCLFAYIILSPFLKDEELVNIFGENLLEKASLEHYLMQLTGLTEEKPFECIGTIDEVNLALYLTYKTTTNKPFLIRQLEARKGIRIFQDSEIMAIMSRLQSPHYLTSAYLQLLTSALHV